MTIDIPQEYESVLNGLVASGAFPNTETALMRALELLANQQAESRASNSAEAIEAMPERVDIELLAKQQNVAPFDAGKSSPASIWPQGQSVDDFLSFVSESRKDTHSRGISR
ncbi:MULTISPECIES: hypothetical protein [Rhodopirellula]|uniref:hypothetical protein n=1 Tax=Rhodopirellula TaxID=265488 RepID=UPI00258088B4|nr:hypothetical protein [Rhodopirellula sp. UBA1907]|tara:strand:+ start:75 stop:410 length:336 start_codon:yes stop_codon:yes gene_type:complete